jgi:FMN phosphatase YigB (HAD superfamily)
VFDVGETLVDETRAWGVWADHLGVPRLTFFAALGHVVAEGRSHRDVFELFAPGIDIAAEARRLGVAGKSDLFSRDDLYPDALPCLHDLAREGYRLAVAANQPAPASDVVAQMGVEFELIATSAAWGVAKPDPAFFDRLARELALEPGAIAYVGDRLDNDVRPARAAGMVAVFIRRGPWGWIQAGRSDPPEADLVIDSLSDLPEALASRD